MKITDVSTIKLTYKMHRADGRRDPLHASAPDAAGPGADRRGNHGLGEAAAYGGSLESMRGGHPRRSAPDRARRGSVHGRAALEQDGDPARINAAAAACCMMGISGIDIALWDIIGQATKTPLYRLLGGYRDTFDAYASAGFYADDKDAEGAGRRGRRLCRARFPHGQDQGRSQSRRDAQPAARHERERLRDRHASRRTSNGCARRSKAVGTARLAIDANNAWTAPVALQFMRAISDLEIAWLEEPVPTEDLAGSAAVARALVRPVAGYETETGLPGFRNLIAHRAVDIVQPDVIWTGGITETRKVAALAQAFHLPVIPARLFVGGQHDREHAPDRVAPERRLARIRPEP